MTNGSLIHYNRITDPDKRIGNWISGIHKIQQSVQMDQTLSNTTKG
ncbi:hypothetical protein [Paenibacillus pabuli]